jgi:hypothetical protein
MAETVVGFALLPILWDRKGLFAVVGWETTQYNVKIGIRFYM